MRNSGKRLGTVALLFMVAANLWGIEGPGTGDVAQAANGPVAFGPQAILAQGGEIRRESVLPVQTGAPRLTGPASAFQPLIDPIFGTNYRANTDTQNPNLAQQEPSIAVNPLNPLNVVAAAKDERAGTNTKQIWIYTSTDGGVTWLNQMFPLNPYAPYSSDPVVNFSDDGILYVTSLPYGGGGSGIQVARSNDGGITFSPGVLLPGTNNNSDKEWTWIDNVPTSPFYHRMYVAWVNFGTGARIKLNYSSDRGTTWSAAVDVSANAYQFPMPVTFPNGDVVVTYLSTSAQVAYRRSTDGGVSFGSQLPISNVSYPPCPPDNAGCGIWRMNPIPSTAVNRNNGNAVVAWADGREGTALIHYSRSTDNGTTWSTAAKLASPGVANTYQVEPWVEADEQGNFHAIWYDDRENPNTSVFHIYYSQSTDNGQTWSQAVRISTAASDLRIGIPTSYGGAAGDYIQVTAANNNVYAAWTDTRSGVGEDIYVVRGVIPITSTPTLTPTPPITTPTSTVIPPTGTIVPTVSATRTATSTSIPPTASTTTIPPTATTTSTATPTVCAITFTDVPTTDPFYASVRCLACRGIVSGYSDGTFRPNNPVTRGQLAKMVSNAADFIDPVKPRQSYEDVPQSHTFWEYIERLSIRGYMTGYPCGGPGEPCIAPDNRPYFRPQANATRGQTSKIVANAARFNEPVTGQTFQDVPTNHTFYEFIQRLASRNVMSGYPCGGVGEPCVGGRPYFRPGNDVTRGQSAKIVANTFFPECDQ